MNANAASAVRRIERNALLAALPSAERARFSSDLEFVPLALGQVLYESGQTMTHAYFPTDCVISLLYVMKNGESAEIAIIGNEGMIGIAIFMGGESTMSRAIVQNAGHAYRLKAQVLKDEFHRGNALSRSLLIFGSALITQMVQTAACNRHHTVDQQLRTTEKFDKTFLTGLVSRITGIGLMKVQQGTANRYRCFVRPRTMQKKGDELRTVPMRCAIC